MNYTLLTDLIELAKVFESDADRERYASNISGFKQWINDQGSTDDFNADVDWEGKKDGRTIESVLCTLFVHINRYAKTYSRSAIYNSAFSTQEEFFYLITLKAYGAMSKMHLIRRNLQDKPTGMQIINRLLLNGWVEQRASIGDKRTKEINITDKGIVTLDGQMGKIRAATNIVAANLSFKEKKQLMCLLQKLDDFHKPIFERGMDTSELLERVTKDFLVAKR